MRRAARDLGHTLDQLDAWQTGQTFPFPFSKAAVDAATVNRLTLTPS